MMGDSEVPLVGGDQAAVRDPTSGPEDTPTVSEQVLARERGSDFTRAPSTLSSLEPAEPAAVIAAVGQAQQRPVTPPLTVSSDTAEARTHTLANTSDRNLTQQEPQPPSRNPTYI